MNRSFLAFVALAAASLLAPALAQAQTYGAYSGQLPLYPYAMQPDQPYAIQVAPNSYLIHRPAASRAYPYVRGAHVVSVSGSTIRTEVTLGAGTFVWNIETSYNTQFYAQSGAKMALSDIQPVARHSLNPR